MPGWSSRSNVAMTRDVANGLPCRVLRRSSGATLDGGKDARSGQRPIGRLGRREALDGRQQPLVDDARSGHQVEDLEQVRMPVEREGWVEPPFGLATGSAEWHDRPVAPIEQAPLEEHLTDDTELTVVGTSAEEIGRPSGCVAEDVGGAADREGLAAAAIVGLTDSVHDADADVVCGRVDRSRRAADERDGQ